jgi:hypothetical protein
LESDSVEEEIKETKGTAKKEKKSDVAPEMAELEKLLGEDEEL